MISQLTVDASNCLVFLGKVRGVRLIGPIAVEGPEIEGQTFGAWHPISTGESPKCSPMDYAPNPYTTR